MSFFDNITEDHLLQAIKKIDQEGIPPKAHSSFYDVIYEGKKYPPKLIASYAYEFLNGQPLDRKQFHGGIDTECFETIKKHGFEIVSKNGDSQQNIWFVTQGSTFPDPGTRYLWAPEKGVNGQSRFYWKNMTKVKKGDFIFHYAKGLRGVSVAVSDHYLAKNPSDNNPWPQDGYKVDIEFFPFSQKININQLIAHQENFKMALAHIQNSPFTSEGRVNQGYLYEFSKEAGQLVRNIYGKPFGMEEIEDFFNNETEKAINNLNEKETIAHVNKYIKSKGFRFNPQEISNFYLSLKTKPFVILAGVSGTGKTQLPRKFAEALGMAKEQVIQIPVRPDWTDGSDLLGYTGLDGEFKPKALSEAIKKATQEENRNKPFFFILDEMNLARVEHYFSDFLSIIETRKWKDNSIITDSIIREESLENAKNKQDYANLCWPDNLYLIGTVNMDETTHAFSRKVLDRANSVEMNDIDLDWTFSDGQKIEPLQGITNSFFKSEFLHSIDLSKEEKDALNGELELLKKVNTILQEADLHFAYRVRDEIAFYLTVNKRFGLLTGPNEAMDFQLMQKVLPRIHGSSERVQKVLVNLYNLLEGTNFSHHQLDELERTNPEVLKYKRSSKKIIFMLHRYEDDRFTSFWL